MEFLQILGMMGAEGDSLMLKNALAFGLGLILHIGKQMFMEQVSLREYMLHNKGRTMLSAGSLVGLFSLLTTSYPDAPVLVYLMGGYCIDNLANKTPLSTKKVSKTVQV